MERHLTDIRGSLFVAALICILLGIGVWAVPESFGNPQAIQAHVNGWQEPTTNPEKDPCTPKVPHTVARQPGEETEDKPEEDPCPAPVPTPMGEGDDCPENEIAACAIAPEETSGPAGDKQMGTPSFNAYLSPTPGASLWSEPGQSDPVSTPGSGGGAPLDSPHVNAASGVLTQVRVDLFLPGGAAGFRHARTYRSTTAGYASVMGDGWEFNTLKRIRVHGLLPSGRPAKFWVQEGNGLESGIFVEDTIADWYRNSNRLDQFHFTAAVQGVSFNTLTHYLANGNREVYEQLETDSWYHLTRSEDIFGNGFNLSYANNVPLSPTTWTLEKVTDDLGREFTFTYDSTHGRLESVEAKMNDSLLTGVYYTYETKADGAVVLSQVDRGQIATEDVNGDLVFASKTESFSYEQYGGLWRLSGVTS